MALIKVVRKEPEVLGGNTEAYISEANLDEALSNGWVKADSKVDVKSEPKKEEPKKEEPKPEVVKEEKVESPKKGKKSL